MPNRPVELDFFNPDHDLPFHLRLEDFQMAMNDVYEFFEVVNGGLRARQMMRLDDLMPTAILSGFVSSLVANRLASHSRILVPNTHHNGHPNLLVRGEYPHDGAEAGRGLAISATVRGSMAVDKHGDRAGWFCVFVYSSDLDPATPVAQRAPLRFTNVALSYLEEEDYRRNSRGRLGTRTATPNRNGVKKLRRDWLYRHP